MPNATMAPAPAKRLSLNLAAKSYTDLERLANDKKRTMTDIVRFGLSLAKLYFEETDRNRKLIIASMDGKAISEIRYPD